MSSSRASRRSIKRRTTCNYRPTRRHRPLVAERLEERTVLAASVSIHSPIVEVNGIAYFPGRTDAGDFQLWRSDGTSAGTYLLKNVTLASGQFSNPAYLANVNGTLFFRGSDAASGAELWKSDGTPGGTVLVSDLQSGATGSSPRLLGNLGGTLYFIAAAGSGSGLWKTDGTAAGTVQVSSVIPQYVPVIGGPTPPQAAAANGVLYFRASDASGNELWKTNGTAVGTVKVKDIL